MEVKLEPLMGFVDSATGRKLTRVPGMLMVNVYDDALKDRPLEIAAGKLHVGMIGTQRGANFMENYNFSRFVPEEKAFIVSECKRLHGQASTAPPVELPPLDAMDAEDDDDGDLDDTELE